jgi:hypothetical protein
MPSVFAPLSANCTALIASLTNVQARPVHAGLSKLWPWKVQTTSMYAEPGTSGHGHTRAKYCLAWANGSAAAAIPGAGTTGAGLKC